MIKRDKFSGEGKLWIESFMEAKFYTVNSFCLQSPQKVKKKGGKVQENPTNSVWIVGNDE